MKRVIRGALLVVVALMLVKAPVANASVDDFTFSSFHGEYYLGSDNEARSTLRTVETLVAQFPLADQNHGIERAIPKLYQGHSTSLKIASVTNEKGDVRNYSTYDSNDNLVLRIGDADRYVHGTQTYVITYTQRDVTGYFADTRDDEFYWNTNGTEGKQPFGVVSATVHLSDAIAPTFTKKLACYQGVNGSKERCQTVADDNTITAEATNLQPGEDMTIALGFTPGTFRGYQPSLWDKILNIWIVSLIISSIVGFVMIFWLAFKYSRASNRAKELEPIVPEYIPPKDVSVLLASQIGDGTRANTTAQLIDLAVRHYMTITQVSEKSVWKQADYEIEIVKPISDLSQEEQEFVQTLFGGTAVGTKLQTKSLKNNYIVTSELQKNTMALTKHIKGDYDLRHEDKAISASFKRIGWVAVVISIVIISPLLFIAGIVALACGWQIRPLTDKGLELRRYLAGLKDYIELAEKDRLKALQSPEAAAKTGVTIRGETDKKLIKLYERTLPYAILFGQEKDWNKQLAIHYEQSGTVPDWYVGHNAFNAAVFTSAMNDFSGSMNSYGAASSSSSGGSTGGGSSGGGGGGGGSGGW